MKVSEFRIKGYPEDWDTLNVRDFLVNCGSVLRVRSFLKGYSFVTFDTEHSSPDLVESIKKLNSKIQVKAPKKPENFIFESIPPHCTIYDIKTGFLRWIDDIPHFIEKDLFYTPSLMISTGRSIDLHIWKGLEKHKLSFLYKNIIKISCVELQNEFEIFIQLNQPPEIYKLEPRNKPFTIWTIGIHEPGWKRTTSIFEEMTDLTGYEIRKLGIRFLVKKNLDSGMIDCLRSIQSFSDFPETIEEEIPLMTEDIESIGLSYQVKFMIYSLISLTLVSAYDLSLDFLTDLLNLDELKVLNALDTIISTHSSSGYRTIKDFTGLFYEYYSAELLEPNVPEGYEKINRVLITPTTVYFRIGEPELSNRVTREYCEYSQDFLRITFTDENLNKILPYPKELLDRIESTMKHFEIAGKTFKILAYSASQLKQHSVWMLCNECPVKHSDIYKWLGDFSDIKVKGKYVARIGLSFSSSRRVLEIKEEEIEIIHDITINGFNFSDGIGTISQELVDEINLITNNKSCAFQFRMGGAKGVVCLDDRLKGRKICLRSSMIKYESNLRVFELLSPSEFRYGFLNRQLIMLLNTLGTDSSVFLNLHHSMLKGIDDDCKTFFSCMKSMNPDNLAMKCLNKLMQSPEEPLAAEIKTLLLKRTLQQLRKKQKIFLRNSGCLIGVIDEKDVLKYGECFLQVPDGVIQSTVVVAKNPCLHPGDIRVLQAVDKKELHHLSNVLVFPCNGPRPHTNECSGSDLDGDLYFVSWEQQLVPPMTQDSMIYDSVPPTESAEIFNHDTMIDFFKIFVTNDKLGQIDNLHLAIADASPDYANDEKCIKLSELHSIAVDFAKSGTVVVIPSEYQNLSYPDFMEHKTMETYESDKVLGLLYREAKEYPEIDIPDFVAGNLVPGYEGSLVLARKLITRYKFDLEMLMKRFGVSCEVELVIAQPLELTNYFQKKKREDEIRELLNINSNRLIEKHRSEFNKHASVELASACYFVSHKELMVRAYPWIIAHEYLPNKMKT